LIHTPNKSPYKNPQQKPDSLQPSIQRQQWRPARPGSKQQTSRPGSKQHPSRQGSKESTQDVKLPNGVWSVTIQEGSGKKQKTRREEQQLTLMLM
jgi:hypothetical protein